MHDEAEQRIPNLPPEAWTDEVRVLFDVMDGPEARGDRPVFNVLLMLANHPRLAHAWLTYNRVLTRDTDLPEWLREIVILRVAWRLRSDYEWTQHVMLARRIGMDDTHIAAIQGDPADPVWSALDTLVIRATDELMASARLADATWQALAGALDRRQIIELLFLIGSYTTLAWVFNAANLQLEAPSTGEIG